MSDCRLKVKRVLLIAYYFPPIAATGSMRPLNFCRHLKALGWDPSVLSTDAVSVYPPQPGDQKLLDRVPADVPVFRVGHSNPRTKLIQFRERIGQWFSRGVSAAPPALQIAAIAPDRVARRPNGPRSFLRVACEAALEFPDPQYRWFRPAVRAMARLPIQERPDVIWATGGPWTNLLVGKRLAKRWKVPFIADFRDPWVGGHGRFSTAYLHRREALLERSVCASAACVILNTEELRERFCQSYPEYQEKFVTLTNGYAVELEEFYAQLQRQQDPKIRPNRQSASPLEICHFGTVYGNRSPVALFQAVEELAAAGLVEPSQIRLRFVGAWDVPDSTCEQHAKKLEERGILKREPPVPHQQCLKEMGQSDVLLILQQNYPLQIPAKIYEYIVAGRPLLILGGDGATANLVQRNRLGHCCPNTVSDIKAAVQSMVSGGVRLPAPASADTAQFSYRVLSARLAELLTVVFEKSIR